MSVDPFVHEGSQGINPYSYIMNNPMSGVDPSGYKPCKAEDSVDCLGDGANEVKDDKGKTTRIIVVTDNGAADSAPVTGQQIANMIAEEMGKQGTLSFNENANSTSGDTSAAHQSGEINSYESSNNDAFNNALGDLNSKATELSLFDDSDGVAEWLHDNAHPISEKYNAEIGAHIYEHSIGENKKYSLGVIVTSYHSGKVNLASSHATNSKGTPTLFGAWHSHGRSSYLINEFSSEDIRTARKKPYTVSYRSAHSAYNYPFYRENNLLKLNMGAVDSDSNNHEDLRSSITCIKGDC